MKNSKKALLLLILLLLFFTVSCQNITPHGASGDYHAGSYAGENAAHEDVLHNHGQFYKISDTTAIRKNIGKYLKEKEGPVSDAYIKGFKWGYKRGFRDSVDTYNGGG
ncbi:hypothetical protein SAMN02746065_10891 [Desulfocicer vacuolatum DSM 3385]|uniref:Uncharacterized protein n=1 Tax=Desulfocicer vacuolatum DSM 3385 TaxID=1121400 RepID=A0A1W2BHL4_9BACT|nr:hypothetical protein [Desulfocicer vacuolatum]SMC72250.1 hypothetical protein SAMN02746065_10891 [Desulfocicer vacuolatum DSM 3385]